MLEGDKKENNIFLYLLLSGCLIAIAVSFYFFYFKKDYDFVVEVSCDPATETCIQRDCTNPEDCPPNGLSDFRRYSLNARDFQKCEKEDCANACESESIKCEHIECVEDELAGESCSSVEPVAESIEIDPTQIAE